MEEFNQNKALEFKAISPEESKLLATLYENKFLQEGARIGPKGFCFTKEHEKHAADVYNMKLKTGDIFVIGYQRSGITWIQELVWLVANDLDYKTALDVSLLNRYSFLEHVSFLFNEEDRKKAVELAGNTEKARQLMAFLATPATKVLAGLPSPRFVKTHLPMTLLPPKILDTAKVVYVARDPRDIIVSSHYHGRLFKLLQSTASMRELWNAFVNDLFIFTPYFEHIKEAWALRDHPNMLFLFYEDLSKDLPASIRLVADFLGKEVNPDQMERLCDHLSFENFKNNASVNYEGFRQFGFLDPNEVFMRKGSHRKAWTSDRILEVINDIKKAQVTMSSGQRRTAMDYYWMNKYNIVTIANKDYLIFKRLTTTAPTIRILPREQYFDVLSDIHKSCGHGGRDKILNELKNKYYIPKKAVEIFLSLCPICETKRNTTKKSNITKLLVSPDFNLRGQVELMDLQSSPDGEFKWLLSYQDHATKFLSLRPLKTKRAVEVASELMKIFLIFGAPYILQSDNGRELTADLIKELVAMWPECKIVLGNPCRSQTSVGRSKQDVENMLRAWMNENKSTNWSVGCFFVQYFENASFHRKIGNSPFKALFGNEPKAGLNGSDIPTSILSTIETEEQLKTFIKQESVEAMNSDFGNNDNNLKTVMENVENLESNLTRAECLSSATGAHKCQSCNNVVPTISGISVQEEGYGSEVVCATCQVEQNINVERDKTHTGLKRAAETMIDDTVKKMPKLEIGNSVLVTIPEADRGPLNIKNIPGQIVNTTNGFYKIGTKFGTIKNWFSRQELQHSEKNYDEEISDSPISLIEAVTSFGSQSFQKCNCKSSMNQCRNKRCACFRNKVHCGSKCHGYLPCVNKNIL